MSFHLLDVKNRDILFSSNDGDDVIEAAKHHPGTVVLCCTDLDLRGALAFVNLSELFYALTRLSGQNARSTATRQLAAAWWRLFDLSDGLTPQPNMPRSRREHSPWSVQG